MSVITSFKPGEFSWCELATSDQNSAKAFYSKLFGWEIDDQPMGPDQVYTMLKLKGEHVAALYGMDKAQQERGIPPHWNVYVTVTSADESAAKSKSLGGSLIMEPFDVMDVGRMAIVRDPDGAIINLWQPMKHKGAGILNEPNAFCWYEVYANDTEKAKAFYTGLFGWEIGGGPEYTEWKLNGQSIGGMMKIQKEWGEVPPHWMPYVMVSNCNETAEKAKDLGATIMVPPTEIPGMGQFALFNDPQAAGLGIYQSGQR
jgi:predicted enzyme related to lactoylglutathione lyase